MNDLNNKSQLNKRKVIIAITSLLLVICIVVGIAVYSKAQSNLKEESHNTTTDATVSANKVDIKTADKSDEPIVESSSSNEVVDEPTATADITNVDEESKATPSAKVEAKAATVDTKAKATPASTTTAAKATTPATTPKAKEPVAHTHSYSVTASTQATCTTQGSTTYTCACGDSYTETTPKTAHSWVATTETKTIHHPETYRTVTYLTTSDGKIWGESGQSVNMEEIGAYMSDTGTSLGTVTVSVVDAPAYDEQVSTTVNVCSVCGARQ